MQIQINTDKNINFTPELAQGFQAVIEHELRRYTESITRIEAHLHDTNSAKKGVQDNRCMLEARIAGMAPISVEHRADTLDLAIRGAASQLERLVKKTLSKEQDGKGGMSIRYIPQNNLEE
jgi:ribosome-associated translation inhibitor RaiA